MSTPKKVHFPSFSLQICGELYSPAEGAPDRHGAGVVISHPMTGVKEQTSADYARALSQAGFHALTFDAGYQGESTGQPRGLEDPRQRVEDIKAAVTYLATGVGDTVDASRIDVLGICASGGYASAAAQTDTRVRALATVSAACVGRMARAGGVAADLPAENPEAIAAVLAAAAKWRNDNAEARRGPDSPDPVAPLMFDVENPGPDSFYCDAAAYYGSSQRGRHPRSDQRVPPVSYDLMVGYDSFALQQLIAPRPLLMLAGDSAQTLHYSRAAVAAAREPKELVVVGGKNHFDLYDDLTETGPKLVDFFAKSLC